MAGANREAEQFANPDKFDIQRHDDRTHLGFGRGIHFCIGSALACLEVATVLEMLCARFPQ